MKRILMLLLSLLMASVALSDGAGPMEETVLDLSELAGLPTHYRLYDRDFFESPDEHAGTVVKIKYKNDLYEKPFTNYISVYLPCGYDENGTERYPVIYFLHGNGGDSTTLLGNEATVNAFDHMISSGVVRPFILVAPSYYYDQRHKLSDMDIFIRELREELMPMIEGQYRTYAETPDEEGFRASRGYRAFCGFSWGSMNTFAMFDSMLDVGRYFLPFAGALRNVEGDPVDLDTLRGAIDREKKDYFLYMACGGEEDTAFEGCRNLAQTLAQDTEYFDYGPDFQENRFFYCQSDNIHQDLCTRYYARFQNDLEGSQMVCGHIRFSIKDPLRIFVKISISL
ncbi:MAG: hypothetical protein IJ083_04410 [Clostridia bacterium]|nr:hypothetical protein [Clostridia bacterium]